MGSCSSLTSEITSSSCNLDFSSHFPPFVTYVLKFNSLPIHGSFTQNGSPVDRNTEYTNYQFEYNPIGYGFEDIFTYSVKGNLITVCTNEQVIFRVCGENCKSCNQESFCSECKDDYAFVDGDHTKCVLESTLENGYYEKEEEYYSCQPACEKCRQGGSDTRNNCEVCKAPLGFYAIKEKGKHCMNQCEGEYPNLKQEGGKECISRCGSEYEYKDGCLPQCLDNTMIYDKKCLDSCDEVHLLRKGSTNECIDFCQGDYLYVSSDGKTCLEQCDENTPYIDNNNNCAISCVNNQYYNDQDKRCLPNCESEQLYYYGNELLCVSQCKDDYPIATMDNGIKKCVDKCDISPFLYKDGNMRFFMSY